MRINRDGVTNYGSYNEQFNKAAAPLVGEMFQTEGSSPIGYISARAVRSAPNDWHPNPVVNLVKSEWDAQDEDRQRFDLSGLGEYEKVLFSCLAWGEYSTYVLTGEMGSGKTTTTRLMLDVLRRKRSRLCGVCKTCDPVIIELDFNKGFRGRGTTDLVRRFQKRLSDTLRQYLRRLFKVNRITDALLEELADESSDGSYSAFDRFSQECERDVSAWNAKSLRDKADDLFEFVDKQAQSGEERLEMMMTLVRLTKTKLRADSACLVFVFDNMDSIWPEAQYEILVEILSYMTLAGAKALVVLRRATFHRLQNQAAFSFGCIEHIGPDVAQIVKRRVQYYLQNWNSIQKAQVLNKDYQLAIKRRLAYIEATADEPHGALRGIANLSGGSVRQGLFASERMLINIAVPFDSNPHYKDDLQRGLLFGNIPGIAPDDPCVANLLLNRMSGEASLLNIRILQLVAALAGDLSKRNTLTLLIMLRHIGNWRNEEVRRSLNYLLNMRRPLLWVDGKVEYGSVGELQNSDDFLYLTEAGHLYLRNLSRDLVYIQEAVASVEWPSRWMPKNADYSIAAGRFRVLRGAIRELMEQDLEQTQRFKTWVDNGHLQFGVPFLLITNRILNSVGFAALRILKGAVERSLRANPNTEIVDEIKDWQSLVNVGLSHEREISGMYRGLDQLSRDYGNLVRTFPMVRRTM